MIQIPSERRGTNGSELYWQSVCEAGHVVDRGHTTSALLKALQSGVMVIGHKEVSSTKFRFSDCYLIKNDY
jgi:hypothetical protein